MQDDLIEELKTTLEQMYPNGDLAHAAVYLRATNGDVTMAARLFVEHRPPRACSFGCTSPTAAPTVLYIAVAWVHRSSLGTS